MIQSTIENNIIRINLVICFKRIVSHLCFKGHQIFKSIIIFNFIDMVTGFFGFKKSSNSLFYNKSMFHNISTFIFVRMIKTHNANITCSIFKSSSLPFSIFISNMFSKSGFFHFFFSFFRSSTTKIIMSWTRGKSFFHNFALFSLGFFRTWNTMMRRSFHGFSDFFSCFWGMMRTFFHINILTFFKYNVKYMFRIKEIDGMKNLID